jgi:hypothetical protein
MRRGGRDARPRARRGHAAAWRFVERVVGHAHARFQSRSQERAEIALVAVARGDSGSPIVKLAEITLASIGPITHGELRDGHQDHDQRRPARGPGWDLVASAPPADEVHRRAAGRGFAPAVKAPLRLMHELDALPRAGEAVLSPPSVLAHRGAPGA